MRYALIVIAVATIGGCRGDRGHPLPPREGPLEPVPAPSMTNDADPGSTGAVTETMPARIAKKEIGASPTGGTGSSGNGGADNLHTPHGNTNTTKGTISTTTTDTTTTTSTTGAGGLATSSTASTSGSSIH